MILICYDGSVDAQAAIERAGVLFTEKSATVLTVWEPFAEVMAHSATGLVFSPGMVDIGAVDAASETGARERAEEGATRARSAGFDAQARTREQETSVAEAIIAEATEAGASAIVVGTRGLRGLKSVLLGSVSHAVLHHADRPVLVVPSADQ